MSTPSPEPELDQVLEQAREALARMYRDGWIGEVAIVMGGNQFQVEERPRRRHAPVKRVFRKDSVVEAVGIT